MKNKKGMELTLNTVVIAILVIIVLVVSILVFGIITGKGASTLSCTVGGAAKDSDDDGVRDIVDACPCDKSYSTKCLGDAPDAESGCLPKDSSCSTANCDEQERKCLNLK